MNSKRTALVCCAFDLLDTDKYVQYSAVQYSAVQYSTVQYSTVQYVTLVNARDELNTLPENNSSKHSNQIMIVTLNGR